MDEFHCITGYDHLSSIIYSSSDHCYVDNRSKLPTRARISFAAISFENRSVFPEWRVVSWCDFRLQFQKSRKKRHLQSPRRLRSASNPKKRKRERMLCNFCLPWSIWNNLYGMFFASLDWGFPTELLRAEVWKVIQQCQCINPAQFFKFYSLVDLLVFCFWICLSCPASIC